MGAGAARVGRTPHITDTQYTDAMTSNDTLESRAGGAGTRMWSGGRGNTGAPVPAPKLPTNAPLSSYAIRGTNCSVIECFLSRIPGGRICRFDLSEYMAAQM